MMSAWPTAEEEVRDFLDQPECRLGETYNYTGATIEAVRAALKRADLVGLPGEIVAGVIETAQRAQNLNGELLPIRVRTSEAGNIEIVCDPVTIAMDRLDALRLAAILRRETGV